MTKKTLLQPRRTIILLSVMILLGVFFISFVSAIVTTNGVITYQLIGGINYTTITFLSNGYFNTTDLVDISILVIGGGGGGGASTSGGGGGGGGAGGIIWNNYASINGNYTIAIGNGGTGVGTSSGTSGKISYFGNTQFNMTALGGGYGAKGNIGGAGGSGGGGSEGTTSGGLSTQSSINGTGYGNIGGWGYMSSQGCGGGGGAGGIGINATSNRYGGNGGAGLTFNIYNGTALYYAGGGGGGAFDTGGGAGGLGGGGLGAITGTATSGTINTGGGGGGSANGGTGGAGGSGIVIIRYNPINLIISVNLTSPTNSTIIKTAGTNFSVSLSIDGTNYSYSWKNLTWYVWYSNGTLSNQTIRTGLSGNNTNLTQMIDDFTLGEYKWNSYACYGNTTKSNCSWGNNGNLTFTYSPFTIHSETYQSSTIIGSYEYFDINISVIPGYQVSYGYLNYNGTRYSGTLTNLGGNNYFIKKNISIPGVNATVNNSFRWEIIMQNEVSYNSTSHNQIVYSFLIDNCSTYTTKLFNFSLVDEGTQILVNGTELNSSVNAEIHLYSYDRSILFMNYSVGFSKINPSSICISAPINNSYYSLDAIIQYSAETKVTEFYNIQNLIIRNTTIPQNITLYDLSSSRSQEFLITYKDTSFLPVENALIEITRKYISEGIFKTVEMPKTDKNGQALGHLVLGTEIYTVNIIKNGVVLAVFDNVAVVCENPSYSQCKLNLNAFSSGSEFTDYSELGNIMYTMDFDESTRIITVTFSTLNGGATAVNLSLITTSSGGINQSICSDQLTSSAGTLSCHVADSFGNLTIISQLYADGVLITTSTYTIQEDTDTASDGNGIVFVLILMLTFPFMFISDKIGFIIGSILGLIIAGVFLLYTQGSWLGIGSSILWLIIAGGIGIYKLSKRD